MVAAEENPLGVVTSTASATLLIYSAILSVDELAAEFPGADSSWASPRRPPPGPESQGRLRLRSGVRFDSRCPAHEPADAHIRDVLLRVAPISAKLEQFLGLDENADHWGALSVHLQTDGRTKGISVAPDELQKLTQLRLRLDLTTSFINEDDEPSGDVPTQ